jgi:hypothetical protein
MRVIRAPIVVAAAIGAWVALELPASAQSAGRGQDAEATAARAPTRSVDIPDVIRAIRHQPAIPAEDPQTSRVMVAPVVGYSPSTKLTLGVATGSEFYRGDPHTTGLSSINASATWSLKQQTEVVAQLGLFGADDRWFVQGDNRFLWTSQDTYSLGTSTLPADRVNMKYDYVRLSGTIYRQLGRRIFGGAGLHFGSHSQIGPGEGAEAAWDDTAYVQYSLEHGFDLAAQRSAGVSLNGLADTRDNVVNATRGWRVSGDYRTFFKGFLGGDSTWHEVNLDARTYHTLTESARHTLAFWVFGSFVVDGVAPYLDLPATGMDLYGRSGRGYAEGRFRGERLMYGEVEYRATATANGLLGFVIFLNTTTVTNLQTGEHLFDTFSPASGAGLRLLLNKRTKTNLCVDVGFGQHGSHGLYLGVQEAF